MKAFRSKLALALALAGPAIVALLIATPLHAQAPITGRGDLSWQGTFNIGTIYAKGDLVAVANAGTFISEGRFNVGHDPTTSPTFWSKLASGVPSVTETSTTVNSVKPFSVAVPNAGSEVVMTYSGFAPAAPAANSAGWGVGGNIPSPYIALMPLTPPTSTLNVIRCPVPTANISQCYWDTASGTSGSGSGSGSGGPVAPTISFSIPSHLTTDSPFTVAATSNSAGAFTYSLTSGPATVSGSTVTLTGTAGTVVIGASEAAATGYTSGTSSASFAVTTPGSGSGAPTAIAAWSCHDGSGSCAPTTGSATLQQVAGTWGTATGFTGTVPTFSAGNGFLKVAQPLAFGASTAFGVQQWVNMTVDGSYHVIMSTGGTSGNPGFMVQVSPDGSMQVEMLDGSGTGTAYVSTAAGVVTTGGLKSVLLGYSGNSACSGISLYVDGSAQTLTGGPCSVPNFTSTLPLSFMGSIQTGASSVLFPVTGSTAKISVYNFAPTSSQATSIFSAGAN
jgi:hypothetical protein